MTRLFDVKPRARRAAGEISLTPSGNAAGSCVRQPALFSGCGVALFHLRGDEALRFYDANWLIYNSE